ncbi:efflux RND transporter periplasmic adaptor subunit [Alteromonas oceanisediminis]|uniref:efflux RND transporter periplasmic adaptor subunit n=1 Tax=Alteromonas oceanisediminis TaxID=2836180 RepID=UPI001BDB5883|nr:efflux RND transporter periplasmic adaptor subunit [Alteromonas oceanisediminis]MBT0586622.1 efflux RND transporter periplasmic adaptor subunit [Alteromonas oceanisediminis]
MLVRWVTAILVCVFVIAGLGFIKFTQVKAAIAFGESFPEPSETVHTLSTQFSQWQPRLRVMGEVVAPQSVTLRTELEGVIADVNFPSGGHVDEGQLLLQLDVRDELAQLEAIAAEIRLAELDVSRANRLLDAKASTKDQLDRAQAQLAITQARAESMRAVISKKSIIAPFSGSADLHEFEIGQFLPAGSVVTDLVGSNDFVWVDFSLPQQYANLPANAPITVSAVDHNFASVEAEVIAQRSRISPLSRSLQFRAKVDLTGSNLLAGTAVNVSVPKGDAKTIIRVPVQAVRYDSFGSYIFTLSKDDKNDWRAARQAVTVLYKDNVDAVLENTLGENVVVATTGSYKLKPGLLTNVAPH